MHVFTFTVRQSSHYKPPANWKPVHLDEMPVPQGSWKAAFDAKQQKYNMQLAAGAVLFALTVGVVSFIIYFPPPLIFHASYRQGVGRYSV